jgi:hypothetical protein
MSFPAKPSLHRLVFREKVGAETSGVLLRLPSALLPHVISSQGLFNSCVGRQLPGPVPWRPPGD